MSYFIGFLIFVVTLAITNQVLAVGVLTPVHEDSRNFLAMTYDILLFIFFIGFSYFMAARNQFTNVLAHSLTYSILFVMWALFALMTYSFIQVMIDPSWLAIFYDLLGTEEKKGTLTFIGIGMGGVLALINGITLYSRAHEQERHNELIEKGHIEDRFRFASQGLESENPVMRISAVHQFYYLAKHHLESDFRNNIFGILCNYLYDIASKKRTHTSETIPTREYQKLLSVLFMPGSKLSFGFHIRFQLSKACPNLMITSYLFPFSKFNLNCSHVNFTNLDLSNACFTYGKFEKVNFMGANLEGADFRYAKFINTDLKEAKSAKRANFYKATLNNKPIPPEELPPSYKKESVSDLAFATTIIVGGVVLWASFWKFFEIFMGTSLILALLGMAVSTILGMFLGAVLGTVLVDCTLCRRIVSHLEHLKK